MGRWYFERRCWQSSEARQQSKFAVAIIPQIQVHSPDSLRSMALTKGDLVFAPGDKLAKFPIRRFMPSSQAVEFSRVDGAPRSGFQLVVRSGQYGRICGNPDNL
jgi:hypothetical protein